MLTELQIGVMTSADLFGSQRTGLFANGLQRHVELTLQDQLFVVLNHICLQRETLITVGAFLCEIIPTETSDSALGYNLFIERSSDPSVG